MEEHPNAALVRSSLEALTSGDIQSFVSLLDDDVEWHEIGRAEPIRGKAALAERFRSEMTDVDFKGTVHDVLANDQHAVALLATTATRGGRSLTYHTAEIMDFRDGKVIGRWAYSDDTAAINEFFA